MRDVSWARVKRDQAHEADQMAAVASGIGEYGIANACYKLAAILRRQAAEISLIANACYKLEISLRQDTPPEQEGQA